MVNLLTNAAKYTDEGGRIWLTVAGEGDEAVLRVRDTGVGIAPELLPRIFDLFTQAERSLDRSQGGLGIGLALVQRLVEMHGGTVEASSDGWARAASSSCVCRCVASLRAVAAAGVRRATATGRRRALARAGGRRQRGRRREPGDAADGIGARGPRRRYDGRAALRGRRRSGRTSVLLDIGLPGLDGYEVARRSARRPGSRTCCWWR